MIKRYNLIALFLSSILFLSNTLFGANAFSKNALVGNDRYETAIEISRDGWTNSDNVVIVNSSAISDALAATPFAKSINAPILLAEKNSINSKVKSEIKRLNAKKIYLIGGEGVLSKNIEKDLINNNYKVDRIKGETREKTALALAYKLSSIVDVEKVAVVNGTNGLADAVSISPIAAKNNIPIILYNPNSGIDDSKSFLDSINIKKSYIIGGNAVIKSYIDDILPNSERINGENRNYTNSKIIEKFYINKNINTLYIAKNGFKEENQLVDALAVGVLAAKNNSPVMIVDEELILPQKLIAYKNNISHIVKVGGNGNENSFNSAIKIQSKNIQNGTFPDKYLDDSWYDVYNNNKKVSITKNTFNENPCNILHIDSNSCTFEVYSSNTIEKYTIHNSLVGDKSCFILDKYDLYSTYHEANALLRKSPLTDGISMIYGNWSNKFESSNLVITESTINYNPYKLIDTIKKENKEYIYELEVDLSGTPKKIRLLYTPDGNLTILNYIPNDDKFIYHSSYTFTENV